MSDSVTYKYSRLEELVLEVINCYFHKIAVIYTDGEHSICMTYHKLIELSTFISNILKRNCASKNVVICFNKPSVLIPSLILGILQAESSFCFIDCNYILEYIRNLQKYINIKFILIELEMIENINKQQLNWCKIDEFSSEFGKIALIQLVSEKDCKDTINYTQNNELSIQYAYVIQTSGTTGQPKIVQVPHKCIIPNILHIRSIFEVKSEDNIMQLTPLTFDPSIIEIFLSLTSGASLIVIPERIKCMPKILAETLHKYKITVMQATPTLVSNLGINLLRESVLTEASTLRILAFGGEECPSIGTLKKWKSSGNNTRFFNLYGITEVSCWATYYEISSKDFQNVDQDIPLGSCLLDTEVQLLNEDGIEIFCGEGQLYIGGKIRQCIINEEDITVFPNKLMRATGDWIYKDNKENFYYRGRIDAVIKHNGKKINISKIENIIKTIDFIDGCSTVYHKEKKILYIFVVVISKTEISSDTEMKITEFLRKKDFINVPFIILQISSIPQTAHGKVDSKALLDYAIQEKVNWKINFTFDKSYIEQLLSSLWKTHTGICDINDLNEHNFVLDGGNSIMAVQLAEEIEWKLKHNYPLLVEKLLNSTFKDNLNYLLISVQKLNERNTVKSTLKRTSDKESEFKFMKMSKADTSTKEDTSDVKIGMFFQSFSRRGHLRCFCHEQSYLIKKECTYDSNKENLSISVKTKLLWTYDLSKCVDASPLIMKHSGENGIVFIGSHSGRFAAIDIKHGYKIWEIFLNERIESSASVSFCGKYVAVGCYDYCIYCIAMNTGILHWKIATGAEVKSSPVADCFENVLYCGSHDKHIYAITVGTGEIIWKQKISNGSIFSSPVVNKEPHYIVAASLDGTIASVNPKDGSILWKFCCAKPIFSSPLALYSGIVVGCVNAVIYFWNHLGENIWKINTEGPIFSSAYHYSCNETINKDIIIIGSESGFVYCIETTQGSVLWNFLCDSSVYATPCVFTNECYSDIKQYFVIVISKLGTMYILNGSSGKEIYKYSFSGEVFSSPVVCDNFLVVGCRDNFVYCFDILFIINVK